MNTRIGLLGGLLAAQALIVAALVIAGGTGTGDTAEGLLPFDPAEAARFTVTTDEEAVALTRGEDGWQLDGGLPADDGKVSEVLEKLARVSAAWPVATSAATAERFEVTEDNFQRRLVIEGEDGGAATLYLGSSPGYRRVHARADGADEVYSIDFSNYEAPAEASQWLDKKVLRSTGALSSVSSGSGWTLERVDGEGDWRLDGAAADQEAADKLAGRFEDLGVLGIAAGEGEPKGSFTVHDEEGEYRLDFYFQEEDDDYSLSSSRVEGRFEIATYIAEQMLVEADDLLPEEEEAEAADEEAGGVVAEGEAEAAESA